MRLLLLFPVTALFLIAILSMAGLGSNKGFGQNFELSGIPMTNEEIYYDENGHSVCYKNFTAVDSSEHGTGYAYYGSDQVYWRYKNDSGVYEIYTDETKGSNFSNVGGSFSLANMAGFITLITAVMLLSTMVGLHILGSGIADTSVKTIIIGTAYATVWGVLSGLSMALITKWEFFGNLIFFVLSFMYCIGILGEVSA